MSILPASHLSFVNDLKEMTKCTAGAGEAEGTSFSSYLGKSLADVNRLLATADEKQTELAVGKTENLHDAMISVEKAETALKLMVQVRNKALDAYHEIMRMQV